MHRWKLPALALAIAFACGTAPLGAQELTDEEAEEALVFAAGNTTFVLLHEIGHMLIDQFSIPILGREEDAVDNLATLLLLWQETDEADDALIDASYGWFLSDATQTDDFQDSDFYGEHSLDLQRGYAIICKMVGHDPERFGELAEDAEIDDERQEGCAYDFEQMQVGWSTVLEPHLREADGPPQLTVTYDPPGDDDLADVADLLRDLGIMEAWAEVIDADFILPNPIQLRGGSCGEANAFYDPDEREVVMCYELVALFADLIVEDILARE